MISDHDISGIKFPDKIRICTVLYHFYSIAYKAIILTFYDHVLFSINTMFIFSFCFFFQLYYLSIQLTNRNNCKMNYCWSYILIIRRDNRYYLIHIISYSITIFQVIFLSVLLYWNRYITLHLFLTYFMRYALRHLRIFFPNHLTVWWFHYIFQTQIK